MTTYIAKPKAIRNADGSWTMQHRVSSAEEAKALLSVASSTYSSYSTGSSNGGWYTIVSESFTGAWQRNVELRSSRELLAFPPIYACVTLIAGDIAKQRMRLTALTKDDVWLESEVPANSPFLLPLRRPNDYQTPYQFWTAWVVSRLLYGNTYVLKVRDNRGLGFGNGNVKQMHVLDPCLVTPFVSEETGEVFYQLRKDYLATLDDESIYVPASEIIHDRVTPLWHPLVGVSPLYAAALSGTQGVNIANNSAKFFENMSRPSGILVAPGPISREQMATIKAAWEANYSGDNAGKTAVLGDGMKYEAISMPASTAQLTEQAQDAARWTAMAFHVPPYKLGLDGGLKFNNMAQQDMDYYKQCLQTHMESMEQSLDAGLEYQEQGYRYRSEFDESGLFRMDPISRAQAHKEAIGASYESINEARRAEDMPPVTGGNVPLSQQQYWPVDVLADRPPPTEAKPAPPAAEPAPPDAAAKAIDLDAVATLLKRAGPPRQRPDLKVING